MRLRGGEPAIGKHAYPADFNRRTAPERLHDQRDRTVARGLVRQYRDLDERIAASSMWQHIRTAQS
jgi:hypothetical protein